MTTGNPDAELGEAIALDDPADRLLALRGVELDLAGLTSIARAARKSTIAELRGAGLTWRVIGDLLGGITAQAAEQLA